MWIRNSDKEFEAEDRTYLCTEDGEGENDLEQLVQSATELHTAQNPINCWLAYTNVC